MRTSVQPKEDDPDNTDEFPGCVASVTDDDTLIVMGATTFETEAEYDPEDWHAFTVTNDGND